MPTPAYLTIIGERQGLISKGANTEDSIGIGWQSGREDQIMVQAVNYGVSVPGGPSGSKRMHRPLTITKVHDKSTPLLFSAACTGERLKTCRLDYYRPSSRAGLEHFFTIELEDAVIIDMDMIQPHCQDPSVAGFAHLERIQFISRHILLRHDVCATMGSDTWRNDD